MSDAIAFAASSDIPLHELEAQITELAGHLNAANYRWLMLIAYDTDGSLLLRGRLPALAGAALVKAIEAAMDAMPATAASVKLGEEHALPYEVRRADALGMVCEAYLHHAETVRRLTCDPASFGSPRPKAARRWTWAARRGVFLPPFAAL